MLNRKGLNNYKRVTYPLVRTHLSRPTKDLLRVVGPGGRSRGGRYRGVWSREGEVLPGSRTVRSVRRVLLGRVFVEPNRSHFVNRTVLRLGSSDLFSSAVWCGSGLDPLVFGITLDRPLRFRLSSLLTGGCVYGTFPDRRDAADLGLPSECRVTDVRVVD